MCNAYALQDLQRLVDILRLTHEFLSEHVRMDPFPLMMGEMTETISLVSFSGRIATQVPFCQKVSFEKIEADNHSNHVRVFLNI